MVPVGSANSNSIVLPLPCRGPQPLQGCCGPKLPPRGNQNNRYAVRFANARSSQPWALLRNPVGILRKIDGLQTRKCWRQSPGEGWKGWKFDKVKRQSGQDNVSAKARTAGIRQSER